MEEIVERMRTFSILKWCGMPISLNPRKCAKMGFICIDEYKMACSETKQEVHFANELAFSTD